MNIEVNGTRLWFDVDGPALVPDGPGMRERPTVVMVHGGPGSWDHSYFKPDHARLARGAQAVYLDLRGHGRSAWHNPAGWTFEACADDLRAFCDVLGIVKPVVYGHSMGGIVAMLYGARHPGHASALVLVSTMARFDLQRLVDGFRRSGGDAVAELAGRDFGGNPVTDGEWGRVFAAFGPRVPGMEELSRRIRNPEVAEYGMEQLRHLDVVDQLTRIACQTLVCVGELDPVTPVDAAHEIVRGLPDTVRQLQVIEQAGHFPWKDAPERYWTIVENFAAAAAQPGSG